MKSAILAAIAGGLLISAQGAVANVKSSAFPTSGDDIVSVGIERARDSQPARVITAVPADAEELVRLYAPESRTRTVVLGSETYADPFPQSTD